MAAAPPSATPRQHSSGATPRGGAGVTPRMFPSSSSPTNVQQFHIPGRADEAWFRSHYIELLEMFHELHGEKSKLEERVKELEAQIVPANKFAGDIVRLKFATCDENSRMQKDLVQKLRQEKEELKQQVDEAVVAAAALEDHVREHEAKVLRAESEKEQLSRGIREEMILKWEEERREMDSRLGALDLERTEMKRKHDVELSSMMLKADSLSLALQTCQERLRRAMDENKLLQDKMKELMDFVSVHHKGADFSHILMMTEKEIGEMLDLQKADDIPHELTRSLNTPMSSPQSIAAASALRATSSEYALRSSTSEHALSARAWSASASPRTMKSVRRTRM